jgi:hypothetical protein
LTNLNKSLRFADKADSQDIWIKNNNVNISNSSIAATGTNNYFNLGYGYNGNTYGVLIGSNDANASSTSTTDYTSIENNGLTITGSSIKANATYNQGNAYGVLIGFDGTADGSNTPNNYIYENTVDINKTINITASTFAGTAYGVAIGYNGEAKYGDIKANKLTIANNSTIQSTSSLYNSYGVLIGYNETADNSYIYNNIFDVTDNSNIGSNAGASNNGTAYGIMVGYNAALADSSYISYNDLTVNGSTISATADAGVAYGVLVGYNQDQGTTNYQIDNNSLTVSGGNIYATSNSGDAVYGIAFGLDGLGNDAVAGPNVYSNTLTLKNNVNLILHTYKNPYGPAGKAYGIWTNLDSSYNNHFYNYGVIIHRTDGGGTNYGFQIKGLDDYTLDW